MPFSVRSKVSILFSFIAILALVSAFMVVVVGHATTTHAASRLAGPSYPGTPTRGQRLNSWQTRPSGNTVGHPIGKSPIMPRFRSPETGKGAPVSASLVQSDPAPTTLGGGLVLHKFNGISDLDQATANGDPFLADVTPPDQGLCVGRDPSLSGDPKAVFNAINDAVRETDVNGNLLFPDLSNAVFFGDPNAFSDPRCFYDPQNGSFFFTIISSASFGAANDTFDDVLVINPSGTFALYQFDTSEGGTCFGDQPHVGYDNNALYVATDQFCNTGYLGAQLYAISLSDLVNEVASPHAVHFDNLSIGSIPVLTLEPAVTVGGSNIEYLENSFPFDAAGNSISATNQLGLWSVVNDNTINTTQTLILSGQLITSEEYFFPVPAQSTGTGAVTTVCDPANSSICIPVQSEPFLNPDDDRMLQVEAFDQNGTIQLWSALDTALTIQGDTQTRDGIAWFEINAAGQSVIQQSYVALINNNMLYPAIFHTSDGQTKITFTLTGARLNPSAAWVNLNTTAIRIAAEGFGAHKSFANPVFGVTRWGDYSAATLDPDGPGIWMATEYIPPPANQALLDNWGTFVFDVGA